MNLVCFNLVVLTFISAVSSKDRKSQTPFSLENTKPFHSYGTNPLQKSSHVGNDASSQNNYLLEEKLIHRIQKITNSSEGNSVNIKVLFNFSLDDEEKKKFTISIQELANGKKHPCKNVTFEGKTALCEIPKIWLKEKALYCFDVSNKGGFAKYDVCYRVYKGGLEEAYFGIEELSRFTFSIRIIAMYVFTSLLLVTLIEIEKSNRKRRREQIRDIDSIIRGIQERTEEAAAE